jgi:type I restriction enzyme R subunit
MSSPEELAREKIDKVLTDCGWILQNRSSINLSAGRGIAIREGLLKGGEADALGERRSPLMDELNLPLAA